MQGAYVLRVKGELDLNSAATLREALRIAGDADSRPVIVDLWGATFMDSMGLNCLLSAYKQLEEQGRRFVVVCPEGAVRHLLEVTKTVEVLEVHRTIEDALGA